MKGYVFLTIAIVSEIFGTSMLKASEVFTKFWPSVAFIVGFSLAFYSLSLAMQSIPLNVAYAIWSGVGTALTALISILIWKERISIQGAIGIILIIAGVVLLNFNKSALH
ncbi:DMT family transporter [Neobacillus cucumis]|uniref:QacE family quaternary ammonium compound efflux SMR transporter n=1 Tax=Neobacillus cucumis TaxID=1740721 RepID=A0A2N5HA07_9BACI|nr:multidrug efflux SMR transporter [Neobacillus cucumis]PLS02366.1 QacE family quaternary ammonium compound efflux SMR transporter [Neobacillus cucumis]